MPQTLAVIGGGYIGLELGTALAKLGSKVTVLEALDRILPQYDADLSKPVMKRLGELGVEVFTRTRPNGSPPLGGACLPRRTAAPSRSRRRRSSSPSAAGP